MDTIIEVGELKQGESYTTDQLLDYITKMKELKSEGILAQDYLNDQIEYAKRKLARQTS